MRFCIFVLDLNIYIISHVLLYDLETYKKSNKEARRLPIQMHEELRLLPLTNHTSEQTISRDVNRHRRWS